MLDMPNENASLIIAVDGGGSTCRARLLNRDGTVLGETKTGPANIATDFDTSSRNIRAAADALLSETDLGQRHTGTCSAYLALAGASNLAAANRLGKRLGFSTTTVMSDVEAAVYGALRDQDGVVVSIGTGSFFVSRADGKTRRVGGRGFLLSDECSGGQLGRELLRRTVRAHDGLGQHSPLTKSVMAQFDHSILNLVSFSLRATPQEYGRFAPAVVAAYSAGDQVAKIVIDLSVHELCRVLDALEARKIGRICLVGGLGDTYRRLLPEKYQAFCVEPKGDTLDGVAALAQKDQRGITQ